MSQRLLEFGKSLTLEAGTLLDKKTENDLSISSKDYTSELVTNIDLEVEEFIINKITQNYPDHQIISEEKLSNEAVGDNFNWIIDPIDGTTNFVHNFPIFSVSVALLKGNETIMGFIHVPKLSELYWGEKEKGSFCNNMPLSVSKTKNLNEALLSTGLPYRKNTDSNDNLREISKIAKRIRDLRQTGSAAFDLACVASGRFDAFWEFYLQPWDIAAGKLLIEEAGGKITSIRPNSGEVGSEGILVSNGYLHDSLLKILSN